MMYYRIQPIAAELKGTYLSVNKNDVTAGLILADYDASDDCQLWQMINYIENSKSEGFVLLNKKSGLIAFAPDNNSPVSQIKATSEKLRDNRISWTLASNEVFQLYNTDMNLNAGGGPYTDGAAVYVWSWGKGQPNEKWRFIAQEF